TDNSGKWPGDLLISSIDSSLATCIWSEPRMDIFCPACQKPLQIADSHAGQMVKCPFCAATFPAPALPSMASMPAPEPIAPPPPEVHAPDATFKLAPDLSRPAPVQPQAGPSQPAQSLP